MQILIGIGIGIVGIVLIIPVLQNLQEILFSISQWFISWVNIRITYNNSQANEIQTQNEYQQINAVGFQAPSENEEYYDDEDKIQSKRKVGF